MRVNDRVFTWRLLDFVVWGENFLSTANSMLNVLISYTKFVIIELYAEVFEVFRFYESHILNFCYRCFIPIVSYTKRERGWIKG